MLTLLHLLSAVALLVWGTHIVRTGVMRVFGARLRTVLSSSVEKKPLAFCAGIGVTALVQSSNATTMLVTSFVAQDRYLSAALIGAVFAIISYSSLAAVLLTATLTGTGVISFPVALCLVIGANLGSGLLAMLNNSGANAAARRVALGSLLFKL
ncbi:hypothetical protein CJ207_05245, partial [Klebsiella aerogenes]